MIAASKASDGKKVRQADKGKAAGITAAAVVAIAVAVTAVWLTRDSGGGGERSRGERRASSIAEVAPSIPAKAKGDGRAQVDEAAKDRERLRAAYKAMTPDERWEFVVERTKKSPLRDEPGTNRIFRTSTEQVMDWIFSCTVGDPPPLLPNLPLKEQLHLAEILISDNPVGAGDSERAAAAKETVQMVKKEFQNFIRECGEPEEFLPYYHGQLVQAHEEWKAARKMVVEAVKQNPDIAADFLAEVNGRLEAKGIKKVTLPQRMLDHYGIAIPQ